YAFRFFIGMAEAFECPGMIWVLGSWYGTSELGKRAVSSGTGCLQPAVHANLNSVHGYADWQWLFVVDGVISLHLVVIRISPIVIADFFMIPDVPEHVIPRARWHTRDQDVTMAQRRLESFKMGPHLTTLRGTRLTKVIILPTAGYGLPQNLRDSPVYLNFTIIVH
ncbi:hypothetical protein L218DRAFT_855065, partial [Marasmius fiardii PR-910]